MTAETGWIAGSAIATGALALVTTALAWKTKDLAKAARDEADASIRLIEEAHRPFLVINGLGLSEVREGKGFELRNIGDGPALGCVGVIADSHGAWVATTGTRDTAAREPTTMVLQKARSNVPDYFDCPDGSRGAIFCRDILGIRHMFLVRDTRGNEVLVFKWERRRVPSDDGFEATPRWAVEKQLWETANP